MGLKVMSDAQCHPRIQNETCRRKDRFCDPTLKAGHYTLSEVILFCNSSGEGVGKNVLKKV